jgi:hypothetical protein
MGWEKSDDNQLEVESFPKEKKPRLYKDKGESNDHLMQGNLIVLFFLPTLTSLVGGASLACPAGADDVEDHISKTLGRSGKSLIKCSPLQRLQGNLGFGFFVVVLSISSTLPVRLIIVGCLDPTSDVVGGLVPF